MANSSQRSDLQRQISTAMNGLRKEMADIGGATSLEMKAAGAVLRRAIKKQLSKTGTPDAPSRPGEPPRRQRLYRRGKIFDSALYKSIGVEVVGGVMRVGSRWFTSRLLEAGVDAQLHAKTKAAAAAARLASHSPSMLRRIAKTRARKGPAKGKTLSRLKIEARPFMQRAIDASASKIGDAYALAVQKKIQGGGSANVR